MLMHPDRRRHRACSGVVTIVRARSPRCAPVASEPVGDSLRTSTLVDTCVDRATARPVMESAIDAVTAMPTSVARRATEPGGRGARLAVDHAPDRGARRFAQARGSARDDGVEDALEVGRRGGDHPQDVGRRGLLLQRLAQLAVALLQLLEEPSVLDGDDRLVRKRLQQCDLLVGERARPGPGRA